jgi:hypothetical protein
VRPQRTQQYRDRNLQALSIASNGRTDGLFPHIGRNLAGSSLGQTRYYTRISSSSSTGFYNPLAVLASSFLTFRDHTQ